MKVFSFSRLSLYETCPHRFYKRYIEKYTEPTTYPLALGTAVHKAVEDKMNGASHEEAVINGLVECDFHEDVSKNELSRLVYNAPLHNVHGKTEVYFKTPLSNEVNAPLIQGFIDVVNKNYIIDWKTNRAMYDVKDNHQVGLYAWAMSRVHQTSEMIGRLFFLRFRRESNFRFTQKEMEEARVWALNLAKEIQGKLELLEAMPDMKDELFPATPSSFCSHCPFAIECYQSFSKFK